MAGEPLGLDEGPPLRPSLASYAEESLSTSLKDASGLRASPTEDYFKLGKMEPRPPAGRATPPAHVDMPALPPPLELALLTLQYLPTPLLVLSDLKRVVLANDAFGLLLGLNKYAVDEDELDHEERDISIADLLEGQTLSQIGIDMIQDGQPIWVSWEKFLDNLAREADAKTAAVASGTQSSRPSRSNSSSDASLARPSDPVNARNLAALGGSQLRNTRSLVHDTVVDVVLSSRFIGHKPEKKQEKGHRLSGSVGHIQARMVISIWRAEDQRYFTLTFASSASSPPTSHRPITRTVSRLPKASSTSPSSYHSNSPGSSSQSSKGRCSHCGAISSPSQSALTMAPYSAPNNVATPSILEKTMRMKDAMLNATDVPLYAMWKDESLGFPNKAASTMMLKPVDPTTSDAYDPLSRFECYTEDFSRQLSKEEYPIVQLIQTQKPFRGLRYGGYDAKGRKVIWDASGEGIYDENNEFIAGLVALKDVTRYTELIKYQSEQNEEQFKIICDAMPEMLWRAKTDGYPDWWSKRWYDYTGLTPEQSLGPAWTNSFHPDDLTETSRRWQHSLATGNEYLTEYRCRRKDGEWRWMLGRALPLRDAKTGKILKWFGTCTDIHELVETRQKLKYYREQLSNVISHARVTMWSIDREKRLTFVEGPIKATFEGKEFTPEEVYGKNLFEFFQQNGVKEMRDVYEQSVEEVLNGDCHERVIEYQDMKTTRWYRTRLVPILATDERASSGNSAPVTGLVGTTFDVTEIKKRTEELRIQELENDRLHLAEAAAKDASRLKSQFLANMSHEIRTPIAGVIGMSEIILDTELDDEQRDYAENIRRSANGLLTVINDILDLSKVESGRLDIEEVQFSLSIVIRDVCKMLSFAAERKNLMFLEDIQIGHKEDLIVLGDPGRCRQILTNLLTNSIKFTTEGHVKLSVKAKEETNEVVTVLFVVEDTGIGIEEEVRKKLFKPFSQADSSTARRFGGTGLGLTISKNLVDLMHGRIWLDSVLGVGTSASFYIPFNKPQFVRDKTALVGVSPLSERLQSELSISGCDSDPDKVRSTSPQSPLEVSGHAKGKPPKPRPQPSPVQKQEQERLEKEERKKIHVLVVEDNAINQQIAIKTIKKLGYSVNAVWNGKEALDYLMEEHTEERPKPDVILMDVQMPILDGYRATHLIRHHSPYALLPGIRNTPIVAMTASAIQGDREKCERAGMDDYLAKPVRGSTLESMLVKWTIRSKSDDGTEHRSFKSQHTDHDSNCADWHPSPPFEARLHDPATPSVLAAAPVVLDRLPGLETEGERGLRRAAAEEKALELRNDKLLSAAEKYEGVPQPSPSAELASFCPSPIALTEENIGKLGQQQAARDALSSTNEYPRGMSLSGGRGSVGSRSDPTISANTSPKPDQTQHVGADHERAGQPGGRIALRRDNSSLTVIADDGKKATERRA